MKMEHREELEGRGYIVEDMGKVHGPEFEGQFRWLNAKLEDFQDHDTSDSAEEAWQLAYEHAWETDL